MAEVTPDLLAKALRLLQENPSLVMEASEKAVLYKIRRTKMVWGKQTPNPRRPVPKEREEGVKLLLGSLRRNCYKRQVMR
jgi:hypothetical protein